MDFALASVEIYRVLQEAIAPGDRMTPLEVSLLDYSGFKIKTLAVTRVTDWSAIDAAITEMGGFWQKVAPSIKDKGLRNLMISITDGLADAASRKNTAYLSFGAQMLLDSVDLVEGQLK